MNKTAPMQQPKPWYREPWPWYLMAGPIVVIIAAFGTAWLAVSSSDGLVTDDYYKKGLAVDQTLARSRVAVEHGIEARLRLAADHVEIKVSSTGGVGGGGAGGAAAEFVTPDPCRPGSSRRATGGRPPDLRRRSPASGFRALDCGHRGRCQDLASDGKCGFARAG